jgi:hypothetical protein
MICFLDFYFILDIEVYSQIIVDILMDDYEEPKELVSTLDYSAKSFSCSNNSLFKVFIYPEHLTKAKFVKLRELMLINACVMIHEGVDVNLAVRLGYVKAVLYKIGAVWHEEEGEIFGKPVVSLCKKDSAQAYIKKYAGQFIKHNYLDASLYNDGCFMSDINKAFCIVYAFMFFDLDGFIQFYLDCFGMPFTDCILMDYIQKLINDHFKPELQPRCIALVYKDPVKEHANFLVGNSYNFKITFPEMNFEPKIVEEVQKEDVPVYVYTYKKVVQEDFYEFCAVDEEDAKEEVLPFEVPLVDQGIEEIPLIDPKMLIREDDLRKLNDVKFLCFIA